MINLKPVNRVGQMIEDAEVVGGGKLTPLLLAAGNAMLPMPPMNISVIDYKSENYFAHSNKVDKRIDKYRGLLPFGITLSKG
ncbi:MAG: hypothetical protein IPH18_10955 [Chitinophagaceae bacterium]|nr:hypothetical protein [Chitinophagaceae bacterium]